MCITKIVSTYLVIYVSEPFTWSLHNIKLNICQEIIGYFDIYASLDCYNIWHLKSEIVEKSIRNMILFEVFKLTGRLADERSFE